MLKSVANNTPTICGEDQILVYIIEIKNYNPN